MWLCGACVQVTLILLLMAPKCKSNAASNLDMPKRSHKGLPLGGKVCMYREKHSVYIVFGTIFSFRHPVWVLEHSPGVKGGPTEV